MHRRKFLQTTAALGGATLLPGRLFADNHGAVRPLFDISLAEWSLHRTLRSGKMTNMDFPVVSKKDFGISAVEYDNSFFKDKAEDEEYLSTLRKTCEDNEVVSLLIMVDGEGRIGEDTEEKRAKTVDNHKRWVTAAKFLGCHSIRVNSHGEGKDDAEKAANCVKGLSALSTFAKDHDINVIVENHGGLSSNGAWMSKVLADVGMDNCGSLPDFGNFHGYDRYKGIKELMPFAKGVSAKSHEFDEDGNEKRTDFEKAMRIVLEAGYRGFVGVEYEGGELSEADGIKATKTLLERVRDKVEPDFLPDKK